MTSPKSPDTTQSPSARDSTIDHSGEVTCSTTSSTDESASQTRIARAQHANKDQDNAPPAQAQAKLADEHTQETKANTQRTIIQAPAHIPVSSQTKTGGWDTETRHRAFDVEDSASDQHVYVGCILKGRFRIEKELGRGGMGVVYLALDIRKVEARDRNPHVAIKVLNDDCRKHPSALIVLQREAMRSQRLAHDNIVHVYDFDRDGALVFMTMEYIEGHDLRHFIRSLAGVSTDYSKLWPIIQGMGRALARAHASGIIHSDFKPGNVLIDRHGVVKVFDFGIARAANLAGRTPSGDQTVFDAGSLHAMTPAYASLNRLHGKEPSFSDDIYAFGCVVYELLTGVHPFHRQSADYVYAHRLTPAKVPGLSRVQQRALRQCLTVSHAGTTYAMPAVLEQLQPRTRRQKVFPWVLGGLSGGVLCIGCVLWLMHFQQEEKYAQYRTQYGMLVARFRPETPGHFSTLAQAQAAVAQLDEQKQRWMVINNSEVMERFLLEQLHLLWDLQQKHFDFIAVQHVFSLQKEWKLYSNALEKQKAQIYFARGTLLKQGQERIKNAIYNGRLLQDQSDNVLSTLQLLRQLQATEAELHLSELLAEYRQGVQQALARGDASTAQRWLRSGLQALPDSPALLSLAEQISHPLTAPTMDRGSSALASAVSLTESQRLQRARRLAQLGQWANASASLATTSTEAKAPAVAKAHARYVFIEGLEKFRDGTPSLKRLQGLKKQATQLQTADPVGFKQLVDDILHYRPNTPAARVLSGILAHPKEKPIMPGSVSTAVRPATKPKQTTKQLPQMCVRSLVASGRACKDAGPNGFFAPELVVIPGEIAMMRDKLTGSDIAAYCTSGHSCPKSVLKQTNAAIAQVSAEFLQQYAQWLSEQTHHRYRLPTDSEWLSAALAGLDPKTCLLAVSNRWGLHSMARGQIAEMVVLSGKIVLRGGNNPQACQAAGYTLRNQFRKNAATGRLVREMQ